MSKARCAVFGGSLCLALAWAPNAFAAPETHDGFYLQLGIGMGYLSVSEEIGDEAGMVSGDTTYSGMTVPFQLLIGGSPMDGLVIGGGIVEDYSLSPSAEAEVGGSVELEDVALYLTGFGPFVSFYPDEFGGLHFDALIGFGTLEATYQGYTGNTASGLLLSLGAGYEFWLSDEWSVGPMFRFVYAPLSYEVAGITVDETSIAPALLATFTYH